MSVLPGQPALLTARADDLVRTSSTISDVIADLRGIVADDRAEAVTALHGLADDVAAQLDRIHERYDGTARAISDYAVELTAAHAKAESTQDDLDAARTEAADAGDQVNGYRKQIDGAPDGADTGSLDSHLATAQSLLARAEGVIGDAEDRIAEARRDMDAAAEDAIARIHHAISDTNEGFWDKVGEFFDDIGDLLAGLADWVGDFLADVWDFLQKLADTIVAILEVVLVLAVALVVLVAIGLSFGLALLVVGALAAFLVWSIASDVTSDTPPVTPYLPSAAEDRLREHEPFTLDHVLNGTGEVDSLGGDQQTVVKMTKVLGPDGWYWTVTLPSTQEWLSRFDGDHGAVNDLDSNLALMLTPALRTQYERAVLDAMHEAGIGPDDHVMLVGFSQGGIMAGHLAAYTSDYNIDAIVVSGAPIDHMPIPDSTTVVSVQHDGDPVPRLDSMVSPDGGQKQKPNWLTIAGPPPDPHPVAGVDASAHNADKYASTLGDNIAEVRQRFPQLDNYFPQGDLPGAASYYSWSE